MKNIDDIIKAAMTAFLVMTAATVPVAHSEETQQIEKITQTIIDQQAFIYFSKTSAALSINRCPS